MIKKELIKKVDKDYNIYKVITEDNIELVVLSSSNNAYQSINFLDKNKMFDICNDYMYLYDILANLGNVNNILTLGGGGFSYPKYYIAKYLNKTMDVVEINQGLIDASIKYLNIGKLYELYDKEYKRLNIVCDDAYYYVLNTNKIYDGIFVDLYYDNKPIDITYDEIFLKRLKKILKINKYILFNYLLNDGYIEHLYDFKNKLSKLFNNIRVITTPNQIEYKNKNLVIIVSDSDINIPDSYNYIDYNC